MKPGLYSLLFFLSLGLPAAAMAATVGPSELETRFLQARAEFLKAEQGDAQALEQSIRHFQALIDHPNPPNYANTPPFFPALFSAYLGAAQSLQGRDAWLPWNKMRLTERGLSTLDRALARMGEVPTEARFAGNNVRQEIRLVAARTFVAVPAAIFHRADQGCQITRQLRKELAPGSELADALAPLAGACP